MEAMRKDIKFRTSEQPIEKTHVGRGIAMAPGVPAAGGFHEFTRVMPENVSDYKANQLPGTVAGGKWVMSNAPTSTVEVSKNHVNSFYSICRREPMPTKFVTSAETTRPDFSTLLKFQNRQVTNAGFGPTINPTLGSFLCNAN